MLNSAFVSPGWMTSQEYFTGIALIQAMPGPLFNISAYIGAGCSSSRPALPSMGRPLGISGNFVRRSGTLAAADSYRRLRPEVLCLVVQAPSLQRGRACLSSSASSCAGSASMARACCCCTACCLGESAAAWWPIAAVEQQGLFFGMRDTRCYCL
jgi:Chromate transporter